MGDFNINLLKNDSHPQTTDFVNTMYSHSLLPNITRYGSFWGKRFSMYTMMQASHISHVDYHSSHVSIESQM